MAKQRHLKSAPIKEALIDLRVTPQETMSFEALQTALGSEFAGYHLKGPIALVEQRVEWRLNEGDTAHATTVGSKKIGVRLHSEDEKYVAQCQIQGFTLSRLAPYESWERLVTEAQRLWVRYVELVKPQTVTRVATRFVNDLRLPMGQGDTLQKYLNKLGDLPDGVPQHVAGFMQRFELMDIARQARMNLTLALQPQPLPDSAPVPIVLDIDCYSREEFAPTDARLWGRLEQLRHVKNETFFSLITESATELYE